MPCRSFRIQIFIYSKILFHQISNASDILPSLTKIHTAHYRVVVHKIYIHNTRTLAPVLRKFVEFTSSRLVKLAPFSIIKHTLWNRLIYTSGATGATKQKYFPYYIEGECLVFSHIQPARCFLAKTNRRCFQKPNTQDKTWLNMISTRFWFPIFISALRLYPSESEGNCVRRYDSVMQERIDSLYSLLGHTHTYDVIRCRYLSSINEETNKRQIIKRA